METTLRAPRPEKVAVVDEVQARLESAAGALLTEYRGLAVKDIETLRRALRTAGGEYKIYKNTLVRRAVAASGHESLEPLLTGPTGIAFADRDVAAVAKVLRDFAKTNPILVVKGGVIGRDVLDAKGATALAELPSREVLLAQIAGLLAAPMQRFAGLLQALPLKFAYALKALIEEQGGVAAEPVADEAAPVAASEPGEPTVPAESDESAVESVDGDAEVAEVPADIAVASAPDLADIETAAPEAEASADVSSKVTTAEESIADESPSDAAPADEAAADPIESAADGDA